MISHGLVKFSQVEVHFAVRGHFLETHLKLFSILKTIYFSMREKYFTCRKYLRKFESCKSGMREKYFTHRKYLRNFESYKIAEIVNQTLFVLVKQIPL